MINVLQNPLASHPVLSHQAKVAVNMVAIRVDMGKVVTEMTNVLLPALKIIEKARGMQRAREKEKERVKGKAKMRQEES